MFFDLYGKRCLFPDPNRYVSQTSLVKVYHGKVWKSKSRYIYAMEKVLLNVKRFLKFFTIKDELI